MAPASSKPLSAQIALKSGKRRNPPMAVFGSHPFKISPPSCLFTLSAFTASSLWPCLDRTRSRFLPRPAFSPSVHLQPPLYGRVWIAPVQDFSPVLPFHPQCIYSLLSWGSHGALQKHIENERKGENGPEPLVEVNQAIKA